jgi:hypothetical protein
LQGNIKIIFEARLIQLDILSASISAQPSPTDESEVDIRLKTKYGGVLQTLAILHQVKISSRK